MMEGFEDEACRAAAEKHVGERVEVSADRHYPEPRAFAGVMIGVYHAGMLVERAPGLRDFVPWRDVWAEHVKVSGPVALALAAAMGRLSRDEVVA
jgi:hypothetical protein